MRWLVTTLLLLSVVAGGAYLVRGGKPSGPGDAAAPSVAALDHLRPDQVQRIDVTPPGQPTVTLTREKDGTWTQPGNWPVRDGEAAALLNTLTGLRTRFHPVPLGDDPAKFGLAADQNPAVAVVHTEGKATTLRFGKSSGDGPRWTFLRVDDLPEVLRLGPDVFPVVARSPDVYRRRQLFPDAERAKLSGGDTEPGRPAAARTAFLGDAYSAVRLDRPSEGKGSVTLKRTGKTPEPRRDPDRPAGEPGLTPVQLAAVWELDADKVRDHVEPAKLRAVLTAVPDLWVEKFVDVSPDAAGLADAGANRPEYAVTVVRANGQPVTLRLGKVARTVSRAEEQPPPQPFAPPPPPPRVTTEEYRYAKLDNNPLVFEVRADKLTPLFTDADSYRDPLLARFDAADVTEVTVAAKGLPPVKLTRRKGNKDADREDDRRDRWYVGDILAESGKVTDLIDQLSRLEAKTKDDRIDNPAAAKLKELALDAGDTPTTVAVVSQPRVADGETPPAAKTVTFQVGKDDADKRKLAVRVAGWPRVSLVDDAVLKLVDRPALAYRGRRLFDTAEAKLTGLTVDGAGAAFALAQQPNPTAGPGATKWALTKPVAADADAAKADALTGDLARLEVTEYVDDAPKPDDIDKKYGLAKPRFAVGLAFTGPGAKPRTLQIGATRDGKPEAFARLDGTGSVFAVPKSLVDSLEAGSLALLPRQLWSVPSDKVTGIEVRRSEANGNESYRLAKDGTAWKLSGPFDAAVSYPDVQPLLLAAAAVTADKYEAHAAADAGKYGFDKPALRLAVTVQEAKPAPPGQPPNPEQPVTRTLVVGKPTADGASTRFARIDGPGGGAVFVLPDTLLKEADKPALGWLDRSILNLDPDRVNLVKITGPTADASVTLKKDDKGTWTAEGAPFAVDTPTVETLVRLACRPPVARLAAFGSGVNWASYGLDKPAVTIDLFLAANNANGSPAHHTVRLGKAEANGDRYVRADDGPAVGVLPPRAAEALARGKLDFVDRTLFAFDPTTLTALVRKKGADEFELAQAGTGWEVVKPAKLKADTTGAETLADELSRLRATKVAAFAPKDDELGKFGLKDPAATLTLKLGGDKPTERVLKLGGPADPKATDGDRYAVAVPADPKAAATVVVLPAALANRLLADPLKFRDRTLAKFVDADKLTLERGDRKVTFAKVDGTWKVAAPVPADAEQADLDEFVGAAARLRADELVADKPTDLKPFGLAAPEAKWTFAAGDKPVLTLLVGAKEKDGPRVFAKTDKGDAVALLDPGLSARALGEFRKRAVWSDLDASQVETVVLSTDGANTVLRKDGGRWVDTAKPADAIDQGKVADLLAALAGLKAERYVVDAKAGKLDLYGLEKPSRVVIATARDGSSKTLHVGGPVGGTGGKQVYAKAGEANRPEVFVLSEADTAKLTRDRAGYTAGK